jgi:hypothetical protein
MDADICVVGAAPPNSRKTTINGRERNSEITIIIRAV